MRTIPTGEMLMLTFLTLAGTLSATEIIAHRGASHDAPENTLAALELGWKQNADADELDIHLTKDGQIVVIHDANTKRTTGVDKPVAEQNLAELVVQDAGKWKDEKFAGQNVPTLTAALATIPEGKRIFIEIKCGDEVLPELARVLKVANKDPKQIAIIAFQLETLKKARPLFPNYELCWLVSAKPPKGSEELPDLSDVSKKAVAAGMNGVDLDKGFPLDKAAVDKLHAAGLTVYVWTVNDAKLAKQFVAAGVNGITTDKPLWLRNELSVQQQ